MYFTQNKALGHVSCTLAISCQRNALKLMLLHNPFSTLQFYDKSLVLYPPMQILDAAKIILAIATLILH